MEWSDQYFGNFSDKFIRKAFAVHHELPTTQSSNLLFSRNKEVGGMSVYVQKLKEKLGAQEN